MKFLFSGRARRDYNSLPEAVRKAANKQFDLLLDNFMHPSLKSKKYDEPRDVWQGRVNRNYRFYFKIVNDVYEIVTILKHPK
ncbi:MAG: hypothetical protein AAB930_04535 [Patescibacteria group bacterium]